VISATTTEVPTTVPADSDVSVGADVTFPLLVACGALIWLTYRRGQVVRRMLGGPDVPSAFQQIRTARRESAAARK